MLRTAFIAAALLGLSASHALSAEKVVVAKPRLGVAVTPVVRGQLRQAVFGALRDQGAQPLGPNDLQGAMHALSISELRTRDETVRVARHVGHRAVAGRRRPRRVVTRQQGFDSSQMLLSVGGCGCCQRRHGCAYAKEDGVDPTKLEVEDFCEATGL